MNHKKKNTNAVSKTVKKDNKEALIKELKVKYYKKDRIVQEGQYFIDFSPSSKNDVLNGQKLSYNEYIDAQINGWDESYRADFAISYYRGELCDFKGQINKISKEHICFEKIYMLAQDMAFRLRKGKEEHVWLDIKGFEQFKVGDCVSFSAEIHRYLKVAKGKQICFGLTNPYDIRKISEYDLPSDDELLMQAINEIICETCMLNKHCNFMYCLANEKEIEEKRKFLFEMIRGNKKEK